MRSLLLLGLLAPCTVFGQLSTTTTSMFFWSPFTNPTLPSCFLGSTPVCATDGNTYANRCVLIILGKTYSYDGSCTFTAPAPVTAPANKVSQTENNGYPPFGDPLTQNACPCNTLFNPVCSNGVTYLNACYATDCAGKTVTSFGPCGKNNPTTLTNPKDCTGCAYAVALVCLNTVTFQSACVATCAGTGAQTTGACVNPCGCSNRFEPVCGADGITYNNNCLANCNGTTIVRNSTCPNGAPSQCPHCAGYTEPVCGVDGVTYDNRCYLDCVGVKKYSDWGCPSTNKKCNCNKKLYLPVCGIDQRTYGNECLLNCTTIRKAYNGVCRDGIDCSYCRGVDNPICGRDGRTYKNECQLECKGIQPLYYGACRPLMPDHCVCPVDDLFPTVCGTDMRNYKTSCYAKCVGVNVAYNGNCGFVGSGCERNGCGNGLPANIVPIYQAYQQFFPNGVAQNAQYNSYLPYFSQALAPYSAITGIKF